MKNFKLIILIFLGTSIFGSAGYFGYQLFIKPGRVEKRERTAAANAPSPTPTPDPGEPEYRRIKALQDSGKTAEARDAWRVWIEAHSQSTLLADARRALGTANMALLFQPDGGSVLTPYTVVKGDALARIASKHQSSAELIQRANSLPTINLQIGQQLLIPSLGITLEIDRSSKTLTLLGNGVFLKEYTLLSAPSAPGKPQEIKSKVLEKLALDGNRKVPFGDKAYDRCEKSILLSQAPAITAAPAPPPPAAASTPAEQTDARPTSPAVTTPLPPASGGYLLSREDLLEIFPLISRNTPVVIH
jgi:LysM repeat protein